MSSETPSRVDDPSPSRDRAGVTDQAAPAATRGIGGARVALAGLNAWLVVVLIPTLHAGLGGALDLGLAVLPLAPLTLGVAALRARVGLARGVLLGAFPPALGLTIAARTDAAARDAYDAITVSLAALSLLVFVAFAAHASATDGAARPTTLHPLVGKEPVAEPLARRWTRRALLLVAGLGGLAITVVAPSWPSRTERIERWGDAADDGAALTAVVAATVSALALGAVIGPALRADRRRRVDAPRERKTVALALGLAFAAASAAAALSYFD